MLLSRARCVKLINTILSETRRKFLFTLEQTSLSAKIRDTKFILQRVIDDHRSARFRRSILVPERASLPRGPSIGGPKRSSTFRGRRIISRPRISRGLIVADVLEYPRGRRRDHRSGLVIGAHQMERSADSAARARALDLCAPRRALLTDTVRWKD